MSGPRTRSQGDAEKVSLEDIATGKKVPSGGKRGVEAITFKDLPSESRFSSSFNPSSRSTVVGVGSESEQRELFQPRSSLARSPNKEVVRKEKEDSQNNSFAAHSTSKENICVNTTQTAPVNEVNASSSKIDVASVNYVSIDQACTSPSSVTLIDIDEVFSSAIKKNTQRKESTHSHLKPVNMSDTTIASVEADFAEAKPSRPSFISPEVFMPATSSVKSFLRNFEQCATANGWRPGHKILYFGTFLDGVANSWYTKYQEKQENKEKGWLDIKKDFSATFEGEQAGANLRRKLRKFNQREGQSVLEYYYELIELLQELENEPSDEDVQSYFEAGLHEAYLEKYDILSDPKMSAEQLRKLVFRLAKQPAKKTEKSCVFYLDKENNDSPTSNSTGHSGPNQSTWKSSRNTRGQPVCYRCGILGHLSFSCPQSKDSATRCFVCRRLGHIARNCSERNSFSRGRSPSPAPRSTERSRDSMYQAPFARRERSGSRGREGPRDSRSTSKSPGRVAFQDSHQGNGSGRF